MNTLCKKEHAGNASNKRSARFVICQALVTFGALESRQVYEVARVGRNDEYGGEQTGRPEEQVTELQRQVLCAHEEINIQRR